MTEIETAKAHGLMAPQDAMSLLLGLNSIARRAHFVPIDEKKEFATRAQALWHSYLSALDALAKREAQP